MTEWWQEAACRGMPLDIFFPERGQNAFEAKKICKTCPVQQRCLQDAIEHEEPYSRYGVYGGLSKTDREEKFDGRKPRKTAAKPLRIHCIKGHPLTEDNLVRFGRDGRTKCKKCHIESRTLTTHCRKGHELTPDNIRSWGGRRRCKKCANEASRAWKAVHQPAVHQPSRPGAPSTHCKHGHEFTAENTYIHDGVRRCRECMRIAKRNWTKNKRAAHEQGSHHSHQRQQMGQAHQ